MKINMVLPGVGHSGGVQMAVDYLEYFRRHGNDVVCYVPFTGAYYGWKKILLLKSIYRIIKSKDLQGKWIHYHLFIKFVPYINNMFVRNADITIATSWLTSYWVNKLDREKGKKVYFIQGFETWGNKKENKLVRTSYHLPFDLRIAVSTELSKKLMLEEKVNSKVICNGVRDSFLKDVNKTVHRKIVIGMPYREQKLKNCRVGLAALNLLDKSKYSIKLYGFKEPEQLGNNIDFLVNPTKDKLIEWYDSVDIFYVPSLYEGWGLPSMEAMSRECVVLAAKVGCLYEFGENNVNFVQLKDMKNIHEVKERLEKLTSSPSNMNRISKNARKTVMRYSFSNQAKLFLDELKKLI